MKTPSPCANEITQNRADDAESLLRILPPLPPSLQFLSIRLIGAIVDWLFKEIFLCRRAHTANVLSTIRPWRNYVSTHTIARHWDSLSWSKKNGWVLGISSMRGPVTVTRCVPCCIKDLRVLIFQQTATKHAHTDSLHLTSDTTTFFNVRSSALMQS